MEKKIDCRKCKFFYITWDKKFPYGCRAIGFKGSNLPSISVRKESGSECIAFETSEKEKKNSKLYA